MFTVLSGKRLRGFFKIFYLYLLLYLYFNVKLRPEGGIEPLRLSTSTGLKPAPRTTEDHLDIY